MTSTASPLDPLLLDLEAFVTLLETESKALAAGDADRLTTLSGERQTLGLGIAERWKALAAGLGLSPGAGFAALREKGEALQPDPARWGKLDNLAREASRLNQINGRLIEEQLRHNQAAIQVLQRAATHRGLYGADGRVTDFLNGNRSIDSA
jgi:flagellar biosynthesis/type III secretory pathway chaperone